MITKNSDLFGVIRGLPRTFYCQEDITIYLYSQDHTLQRKSKFNYFTIYYQIFGLTYWQCRHEMTTIWVNGQDNFRGKSIIQIYVDNKMFSTNPMASVEQKWLIQEIKDWIAVQLASELVNPKITGGG